MPSLTSFSALFLLCLRPNYFCSAKELEAQTRELLSVPASDAHTGELCWGWHGHWLPRELLGLWFLQLGNVALPCSQALGWGFWHNTVCGFLLQLRILAYLI